MCVMARYYEVVCQPMDDLGTYYRISRKEARFLCMFNGFRNNIRAFILSMKLNREILLIIGICCMLKEYY